MAKQVGKRFPLPTFIAPMKALSAEAVPAGAHPGDWHCEVKYDGYRAIALLKTNDGKAKPEVQLWSRNHKPMDYPEISEPLRQLARACCNAVLDGELVALDPQGHSNFQTLQGRDLGERPPIVYYVFDILHLDGQSLLKEPIETRRAVLEKLFKAKRSFKNDRDNPVKLSPSFDVAPGRLLDAAKSEGLEGIVIKRRGSHYEPDRRSGAWLKIKNVNEQEFVIGGFTPPKHSRQHFGAILVGYYHDRKFLYAGKVGTGFDVARLATLHTTFKKLVTEKCPFSDLPRPRRPRFGQGMTAAVMKTVTWLRPKLVAQIKFAEWTQENLLRQPVFLGLRKDKPASEVRREKSAL